MVSRSALSLWSLEASCQDLILPKLVLSKGGEEAPQSGGERSLPRRGEGHAPTEGRSFIGRKGLALNPGEAHSDPVQTSSQQAWFRATWRS